MDGQIWESEFDEGLSISDDEIEELENDEISAGEAAFIAGYEQDGERSTFLASDELAET